MALIGLFCLLPGLILIGFCGSISLLYGGLALLGLGCALTIPSLTALVSLYSPSSVQGKAMGTFRSLGALARIIGPLAASLVYWKFDSSWPYLLGALFLFLPISLAFCLPKVQANSKTDH